MMLIAEKIFNYQDQLDFASFSGDSNPMHMDEVFARRTQAGKCAIHGMHAFAWALENAIRSGLETANLESVSCQFNNFMLVNDKLSARMIVVDETKTKLEVIRNDAIALTATLKYGARVSPELRKVTNLPETIFDGTAPLDLSFEELSNCGGWLLPAKDVDAMGTELFPNLSRALGDNFMQTLGLMSTIVGMIVPGLHSIFSGFTLKINGASDATKGIGFKSKRADKRVRLFSIEFVSSICEGEITAFMRFPPIETPSMQRVATLAEKGSLSGKNILVIGGSRGIGAVSAKLVAAGGADVMITYASGAAEAQNTSGDINAFLGKIGSKVAQVDVLEPSTYQNIGDPRAYTDLYFFATPKITADTAKTYSEKKLLEYLSVYVDGFYNILIYLLESRKNDQSLRVFYPSTIYIEARPRQMTEYAMAKSAAEIMCLDLQKGYPMLSISIHRLPRVLTDQTASVPPMVNSLDPLAVMAPIIMK